ncbi:MAG: histidine kinase, partial [Nocardioides sp.]
VEAAGVPALLGSGEDGVSSWYPAPPAEDRVVEAAEVRHLGARVGTLYVVAHPDQRLTRDDRRMLADLAAQAGAALHAVALSAELARRLDQITLQAEELAESRRRLTVAHSQERLRLQRDLHDGVQQRLVAVAMRVGTARAQLGEGSGSIGERLAEAEAEVGASLDEIREIARGLHPSTLAARGLPAALRTRANVAQQPVTVLAGDLEGRRLPDEIEAAVYYSCLEALQNAAKHAPGSTVEIRLQLRDDQLTWSVSDDGAGFDVTLVRPAGGIAGLRDRVAALRGRLDVESGERGTTLHGSIPLEAH